MESNLASVPEPSDNAGPSFNLYNSDGDAKQVDGANCVPTTFCSENCIPVDAATVPGGTASQPEGDSPCKCDTQPTVQFEGVYNPEWYDTSNNKWGGPSDPYICQRCLLENTVPCPNTQDWAAGQKYGNGEDEFAATKSSSNNCQAQRKEKTGIKKSSPMPTVVVVVLNKPLNAEQYSSAMSPSSIPMAPHGMSHVQFQLPQSGSQQQCVDSAFGNMPGQNGCQFCSPQAYNPGLNSMNQEPKDHKKTRRSKKMNEVNKAVLGILQNENCLCFLPDLAAKKLLDKTTKKKKLRSPFDRFANPPFLYEPKLFVPSCNNYCNNCCYCRCCNSCCNSSICW